MSDIILHELPPSPNNVKVRLALGYKGLDYERRVFMPESYPGDRSPIIQASSQPLTPALEYKGVSLFDSGAILRFLEANFRDTPRIFSEDYGEMKAIEKWEWFARTKLGEPVGMVFGNSGDAAKLAEIGPQASALMQEVTADIEKTVASDGYLVGKRLTAADITAVPLVAYAMVPEPVAAASPLAKAFHDHLALGDGRSATREWVMSVLQHDPHPAMAQVEA